MIVGALLMSACSGGVDTTGKDPRAEETETAVDSADSDTGTDSGDTQDTQGSDTDTATDTDTGGVPTTEIPGNGIDEDLDGEVDEFRSADAGCDAFAVQDVEAGVEDPFVALTNSDGDSLRVLSRAQLLGCDWLYGDGFWIGDLRDGGHNDARWIPDVDGDGHEDLLAEAWQWDDDDLTGEMSLVYAWSDVTTRDTPAADAIAWLGDWSEEGRSSALVLSDAAGGPLLSYVLRHGSSEGTDWIIPISCLTDGYCGTDEAVASIADVQDGRRSDGPFDEFDADGDGVSDLLVFGVDGGPDDAHSFLFSGTQLDAIGLTTADAASSFEFAGEEGDDDYTSAWVADLNGDGHGDLFVLAGPNVMDADRGSFGYAVLGPLVGATTWSEATATWPLGDGVWRNDSTILPDLDGDGLPEVAMAGQPGYPTYDEPSRIDIVSGATLAAGGTLDPSVDRWAVINGAENDDQLGYYLYPYDFDGDGRPDLAAYGDRVQDADGNPLYSGTALWFGIDSPG